MNDRLCNSTLEEIKKNCNIIFVCVPTPMKKDGSCDISIVESIINQLANLENGIVVVKSTVPPGTIENLNKKFRKIQIIFNQNFD